MPGKEDMLLSLLIFIDVNPVVSGRSEKAAFLFCLYLPSRPTRLDEPRGSSGQNINNPFENGLMD
ncbi:MAG TPA: hypothetical protein P5551_11230 [Syntrophales bacterium]|jgi:hypothetical protein|nr:hypothetical protein [Syntrophales bacterium]HRT62920.1 hypothetical protein [Syntrophales bacterium]